MRRTWRDQRVNRKIVLVGGFVAAMVGAHGFAWSAGDPHAAPTQDAPAASSVPSNADGAGAEDRGRGGRQGRKACAEDVKKLCACSRNRCDGEEGRADGGKPGTIRTCDGRR